MKQKWSQTALAQMLRFGVAGGINTLASFLAYAAAIKLAGAPFWLANFAALIAGICCGFILSSTFVFSSSSNTALYTAPRYVATIMLQFAASTTLLWILIKNGVSELAAYVFMLPFIIILSFTLQKYWVFSAKGVQS